MRPERGDILDNFTPDTAEFVAALVATMPGCKLAVRRSRRRPLRTKRLPLYDWTETPGPSIHQIQMANAATRALEPIGHEWLVDHAAGAWREAEWCSPAQRGRKTGRQRPRHRSSMLVLRFAGGEAEVCAHPMCPEEHATIVSKETAVTVALSGRKLQHVVAALLAESNRGFTPKKVLVTPRHWADLNREGASYRAYGEAAPR